MTVEDQVFCLRSDDGTHAVWKAMLDGRVLSAEWLDKGAAEAGLEVERRRAGLQHTFEAVWARMPDREKGIVRLGVIPVWAAAEIEKAHQLSPREIAVGFFRCARNDGGMRA